MYPRGALHLGHVLVQASSPLYHKFTHFSQPKMLLQHLVTIMGGVIGTLEQIGHLKVSLKSLWRLNGTFKDELNDRTSFNISFTEVNSARVSFISCISASRFLFLDFTLGAENKLNDILGRVPTSVTYAKNRCHLHLKIKPR